MAPPETEYWVLSWISAFWDLSSERQVGMSLGVIPASKIKEYAGNMHEDLFAEFKKCIQAMDSVFLGYKGDGDDAPRVSSRSLTPELMTSMFGKDDG